MENEEEPQRPEAATHPPVRPSVRSHFLACAGGKREGEVMEERERRGDGGELSQVDSYLPDSTLPDSSRYERLAQRDTCLSLWLQCRYMYYGQL